MTLMKTVSFGIGWKKIKKITIIVKEIMWVKRNRRTMPTPTNLSKMGQMVESHPKLSVLEWTWEFKIIL